MTLSSWTNKPVCALYDSKCGGNPLDDNNVTRKPATFNGPVVLMGDPSLLSKPISMMTMGRDVMITSTDAAE